MGKHRPYFVRCLVSRCERRAVAKDLCTLHYQRLWHHGSTDDPTRMLFCSVSNCNQKHKAKGFCRKHYRTFHKTGFPTAILQRGRPPTYGSARDRRLAKILSNIKGRCEYPLTSKYQYYGGRGIKNVLTLEDLVFLWERDSAEKMGQPSIDRKDTNADYTVENCQFIEMDANRRKRSKKRLDRQYSL